MPNSSTPSTQPENLSIRLQIKSSKLSHLIFSDGQEYTRFITDNNRAIWRAIHFPKPQPIGLDDAFRLEEAYQELKSEKSLDTSGD
jgi:hypothetical protein